VTIEAEIEFLVPADGPLFTYARETPPGAAAPSAQFVSHAVQIRDVREGGALRLEEHGAVLGSWPTRARRFDEETHVRKHYYAESAEIIRAELRADSVVVFDHNVRRNTPCSLAPLHGVGLPVHHAHTDYTPRSALRRLHEEFGVHAEAEVSRYLQVNLWRPIRGPVRDAPLAICDGASVAADALRTVELRYPDRKGEICYLVHERGQRWCFASDMAIGEAWLFKNFDSARVLAGGTAPHSAFIDPRYPFAPPRESIEVRALAVFR
jgi:hypothetical protein